MEVKLQTATKTIARRWPLTRGGGSLGAARKGPLTRGGAARGGAVIGGSARMVLMLLHHQIN